VAFPGHCLVRFDDPERFVLADAFYDGQSVSLADCRLMLARQFADQVGFSQALVEPADTRTILVRLLENLRSIYLLRHDWPRLRAVLRRLAAAEPDNGRHLQELAALHTKQGDMPGAYAHLAVYLERQPHAPDRAQVRYNLQRLAAAMLAWN
jgi:regulator of sirC expression with transglutaminase-like and TPR domain